MARAALPVGAWSNITSKRDEENGQWRASCRFRDYDGVTRPYSRHAATKGKAENKLLAAMSERQGQGRRPDEKVTLGEVASRGLTLRCFSKSAGMRSG